MAYYSLRCASSINTAGASVYYTKRLPDQSEKTRVRSRGHHDPGDGPYDCTWTTRFHKYYLMNWSKVVVGPGCMYENYRAGYWDYGCMIGLEDGWEMFSMEYNTAQHTWSGYHYKTIHYDDDVGWWEYQFSRFAPSNGTWGSVTFGQEYDYQIVEQWFSYTTISGDLVDYGFYPRPPALPNLSDTVAINTSSGLDSALSQVYTEACTTLPRNTVNNIGNIFSIISTLKSMAGGFSGIGKVSDAWLGYRYVYGTTVSDIHETVSYLERLSDLAKSTEVRSNAVLRKGDYTFRCSVHLSTEDLDKVSSFAEKWGIALTPYVAWDLVPYSFIVDWFLDIGNLLEYYQDWGWAMKLTPSQVWFSVEHRYSEPGSEIVRYYRWSGPPPRSLPGYTRHTPGLTTLLKRGADLLALSR